MNITFYAALEYVILLLIVISCLYTSIALIISAIEHIKEFRGNNRKISPNCGKAIWHPAQGDYLPPIDKEVIVLLDNGKVCFAHRPVESYTGISIINHSEMEEYYPERYGKGGWSIPDVEWWLDADMPQKGDKE